MEDLELFLRAVRDIAAGNEHEIVNGEDPFSTIELNALTSAAHAFVVFSQVRELCRMRDEFAPARDTEPMPALVN